MATIFDSVSFIVVHFSTAGLILLGQLGGPLDILAEIAIFLAGSFAIHSIPTLHLGVLVIAAGEVLGSTALVALVRVGGNRCRRRMGRGRPWGAATHGRAATVLVVRTLPVVRADVANTCRPT